MTLNNFIKSENITHIDLLKIDTEGKDYDILKSFFNNPIILPDIIITEDKVKNKENDYSEQNKIADIKRKLLEDNNYIYEKLDDFNSKYLKSNLYINE